MAVSNGLPAAQLHILLALADGEKHGYAVMTEIESMTGGDVSLGPGALYGAIKRLLENKLIEESNERPDPAMDDSRRRYYRLTGAGEVALAEEVARLERLTKAAQRRLSARTAIGGAI